MKATASAHPNIAIIKYWGKSDPIRNLPAVDSLSITLDALLTTTTVAFDANFAEDVLILDGQMQSAEHDRFTACLDALRSLAGDSRRAKVVSENNFPTAAGLASSASGYAALVVAGAAALNLDTADERLHAVARIGSGSAPRSLLGGIVALRITENGSSCDQLLPPDAWPLQVAVAVTTESEKPVSSRDGMTSSKQTSSFYESWITTHAKDMEQAEVFVQDRNFFGLADLAEHNCLKMHAVMLSAKPPLIYWTPTTVACMQCISELRRAGVPVFYTVDAGPQVKAICLPEAIERVAAKLADIDGVLRVITGGLGAGAARIG